MKNDLKVKLEKMDYHRNGVCGAPFYVVLFDDLTNKCKMVATVFTSSFEKNTNPACAVYDIAQLCEGNIEFANGNSWRGDHYFWALKPQMEAYWKAEHGYNLNE